MLILNLVAGRTSTLVVLEFRANSSAESERADRLLTRAQYMTPSIIQCDGIIRIFGHTRTNIKARGMLCQSAGIHLVIELIFWYLASLNLHQVEIFGTRCGLRTCQKVNCNNTCGNRELSSPLQHERLA